MCIVTGTNSEKDVVDVVEEPSKIGKLRRVSRKHAATPPLSPSHSTPKRARRLLQARSESSHGTDVDNASLSRDNVDVSSMTATPIESNGTIDEEDAISRLEQRDNELKEELSRRIGTWGQKLKEQQQCLESTRLEYEIASTEANSAESQQERMHTQFGEAGARFTEAEAQFDEAKTRLDEAKMRLDEARVTSEEATIRRNEAARDRKHKQEQMEREEALCSATEGNMVRLMNIRGPKGGAPAKSDQQDTTQYLLNGPSPPDVGEAQGGHQSFGVVGTANSAVDGQE
ncbi:Hypothetical protein D9617_124g063450 [Elsinoe fawcettii]|nr:Hypothetical protein D9617_124g063450 [Elsinoe fawcettii]